MTAKSKIALGLFGAIAAGVAIGLMMAPDKGSETRKRVKDKAGKLMGDLNRFISRQRENGHHGMQEQRRGKDVSTAMG